MLPTAKGGMGAQRRQRTTVRIDGQTHEALRTLAEHLHMPMQGVLAQAIELFRRQLMVEEANAAYAALRANADAQRELDTERAIFANALMDGLHDDPYPI